MFVTYRVSASHLKAGSNELVLTFPSAYLKVYYVLGCIHIMAHVHFYQGKDLEKKHGKFGLWNGDSSRLHVRKAQYK